MANRKTTEPTTDEHGYETHPAFGMISASRITHSRGAVLFDSDITHRQTIRVTIERASRKRDLNSDWIHGEGRDLIEVEMSEAQWASFVSSMNTSGVPCTLRRTESEVWVDEFPYAPRLQHSMDEVRGVAQRFFAEAREALAEYEEAVTTKAGARVVREKLRKLHSALENSQSNVTFAAKSLNEHTENVVTKARADIEAMVTRQATALGLEAGAVELPELTAGGEVAE